MRATLFGLVVAVAVAACMAADPTLATEEEELANPAGNAIYCPADYDGDGLTDFAVKSANGTWYIDLAACTGSAGFSFRETNCANDLDDDNDGYINDGCPAVGSSELTVSSAACDAPYSTVFDDDNDSFFNDGCPVNRGCLGQDGFGGRWDFAYPGYGDNTAIPVPADYGSIAGPADGKADLAVKDASGFWGIDFADNGFGKWDLMLYGYGNASGIPFAADFDGDGKADLAIWTTNGGTTYGQWYFDYSSDGFHGWNTPCANACPCTVQPGTGYVGGYGSSQDIPVVGDFNGDGCADISVKSASGDWYFDLMGNGFGWDAPCPGCSVPLHGYGDSSNKPVVADYDGDGKADLSVFTPDGHWSVDFAWDGFGAWNIWPFYYAGWGGGSSTATMHPGHFTSRTGLLDQGVKDAAGNWYLDQASTGYNNLDNDWLTNRTNVDTTRAYISSTSVTTPVLSPTCGDGTCSAAQVESCVTCAIDCGPCAGGNFHEFATSATNLKIGVRYTANVLVAPGTTTTDNVSVKVNPDLHVPASLNIVNVGGHVLDISHGAVSSTVVRRLAFTCSQWGQFPLGFMLNDASNQWLNPDFGIQVTCTSSYAGLYGTVTDKQTNRPIAGATVRVDGIALPNPTTASGFWSAASTTGGPHQIQISKAGYAPATAVNVQVPWYPAGSAGVEIDTPLEQAFNLPAGITYTTYIDYSRGRTILHSVRIDATSAPITFGKVASDPGSLVNFTRLADVAASQNAPVMINGIWWMNLAGACTTAADCGGPPCIFGACASNYVETIGTTCDYRAGPPAGSRADTTRAIGYFYLNGFVALGDVCEGSVCRSSEVECAIGNYYAEPSPTRSPGPPVVLQPPWQAPMFAIRGTGTAQRASINLVDANFLSSTNGWKRLAAPYVPGCPTGFQCPIYDAASPFNQSDYTYALQMGHMLLKKDPTLGEMVIARGVIAQLGSAFPGDVAFARTTVGTSSDGTVTWFVVADGEGIDGGNGATANQMGVFYRDILGAANAMIIDSGESTELLLRGASGPRRVNTLSSENNATDGPSSPSQDYVPSGRVFAYIRAGS